MLALHDLSSALLDAAAQAGADAADAIATRSADISVSVRSGALEEAERAESVDFGLRVFIGKRQACVSASDPSPGVLAELAARAVAMAREAPEDPWCGLAEPASRGEMIDAAALELADGGDAPEPAALEAAARALEEAALSVDRVDQIESASASASASEIALAASDGFSGGYRGTRFSLGVSAIAGAGLEMQSDYDYATRRWSADLPPAAEIGARAGQRAAARLGPRKPPKGAVPVLFDRRVSPSLIGHLLSAANGASIARGSSWLKDRMGEAVLPDWAQLVEDPLRPRGPSSRPFDGEGMAAAVRPVVEDGRLTRWLLDWASARRLGLASTGNARRGVSAPPSPGSSNMSLSAGDASVEALMRDMGSGFLVTAMMGSSVNPTTGAYSRGASGFWIENGAIAYPVAEATIAGSLPDFLPRIVAADDPDPHASLSAPSLLVDGLVVA